MTSTRFSVCVSKSLLPFNIKGIEIVFNNHMTQMPQSWKKFLQYVSVLSCIPKMCLSVLTIIALQFFRVNVILILFNCTVVLYAEGRYMRTGSNNELVCPLPLINIFSTVSKYIYFSFKCLYDIDVGL